MILSAFKNTLDPLKFVQLATAVLTIILILYDLHIIHRFEIYVLH